MSDESLSGKRMDEMDELVYQHDQAVIAANAARLNRAAGEPDLQNLANSLRDLHLKLEAEKNLGADWSMARALEDRIGAKQHSHGDVDEAQRLLQKYQ